MVQHGLQELKTKLYLKKKKKAGFDSVTACKKLITTLLVWLFFFFLEGICFLFLPRNLRRLGTPDQNLRCLQFFGSLLMLLPYRRTYLCKPLLMQVLWLWTESKEVFAQVVRNHRDEDFQEVADNILEHEDVGKKCIYYLILSHIFCVVEHSSSNTALCYNGRHKVSNHFLIINLNYLMKCLFYYDYYY